MPARTFGGEVVMQWTWSWVPYGGQAHFGDNPVFDWVRVACVVVGCVQFCLVGRVLVESQFQRHRMPRTQRARFIALALADASICLTEVAVVGTPATPRLVVNVLVNAFGLWGVWGVRRKQRAHLL